MFPLTLIPVAYRLGAAIAGVAIVVAALGGIYLWIDHGGYVRGTADTTAKYEKQLAAIDAANKAAIEDVNAFVRKILDDNKRKDKDLQDALDQVDDESAAAPDADQSSLDRDSVRRLNRIK